MSSSSTAARMLAQAAGRRTVAASAPVRRQLISQPAARRGYASGHGQHQTAKSSDLPWLIGAVGVTVPGAAYLLSGGSDKAKHHGEPSNAKVNQEEALQPSSGEDNPKAAHGSGETGRKVPPSPSDNSDLAESWDEKKEGHDEVYKKEVSDKKQTRVASSASDMPSKRAAGEHPKEDPQKGEGEGVQKGGPAS